MTRNRLAWLIRTSTSSSVISEVATGQPKSAQHHLATHATMFRDMAMQSWLEKAKAAMDEGAR